MMRIMFAALRAAAQQLPTVELSPSQKLCQLAAPFMERLDMAADLRITPDDFARMVMPTRNALSTLSSSAWWTYAQAEKAGVRPALNATLGSEIRPKYLQAMLERELAGLSVREAMSMPQPAEVSAPARQAVADILAQWESRTLSPGWQAALQVGPPERAWAPKLAAERPTQAI